MDHNYTDVEIAGMLLKNEVEAVQKYAKLIDKIESPDLKNLVHQMHQQELGHAKQLHNFMGTFLM